VCDAGYFEGGPGDADDTEDREVDPAGLAFDAVVEEDDEGEEEGGRVDAELSDGDCFLG